MPKVYIEKVKNGFVIEAIDASGSEIYVASSYYDITDVLRKIYSED